MAGNKALSAANKAKQDEFYTQLVDIENELKHYKEHFRGKVVLCNCDDPYESNFFKYFAMNFSHLGLKKADLYLLCRFTGYLYSTHFFWRRRSRWNRNHRKKAIQD